MKNLFFFSFLILMNIPAQAMTPAYDGRLLEKNQTTGLVLPQYAFSLRCVIFSDKVVADYTKADNPTKHIEFLNSLPAGITDLIAKAATGTITNYPAPTDIGNKEYYAFDLSQSSSQKIELGSVLDSRYISNNDAPEAKQLKEYIDSTCDSVKNM